MTVEMFLKAQGYKHIATDYWLIPNAAEDSVAITTLCAIKHYHDKKYENAIKIINDLHEDIQALLKKGKGVWPQKDYIRDEQWNFLRGRAYALNELRNKLGEDVK